jgi:hypothetical protein
MSVHYLSRKDASMTKRRGVCLMVVEDFGGLAEGHRQGVLRSTQLLFFDGKNGHRVLSVLDPQQLIE